MTQKTLEAEARLASTMISTARALNENLPEITAALKAHGSADLADELHDCICDWREASDAFLQAAAAEGDTIQ